MPQVNHSSNPRIVFKNHYPPKVIQPPVPSMILTDRKNDCCWQCGYQFDYVLKLQVCPYCHESMEADQLINQDEDYAWVL